MSDMKPHTKIKCFACDGHGMVDRGYHDPDECSHCGGSGEIVRYSNGSLAKYYGGPMLAGPDRKHRAAAS